MNKRTPPGHFVPTIVPFDTGEAAAHSAACPDTRAFEWGDESTSVPEQQPVAAYFNGSDDLIIRQRDEDAPEDTVVIIRENNIDVFANHLFDLLGWQPGGRRA